MSKQNKSIWLIFGEYLRASRIMQISIEHNCSQLNFCFQRQYTIYEDVELLFNVEFCNAKAKHNCNCNCKSQPNSIQIYDTQLAR